MLEVDLLVPGCSEQAETAGEKARKCSESQPRGQHPAHGDRRWETEMGLEQTSGVHDLKIRQQAWKRCGFSA